MRLSALFLCATAFVCSLNARPAQASETVTLLDRGEPYHVLTADGGVFWIGHSRKNFNSYYRLEAWSPKGELIAAKELPHSLMSMKAAPGGGVMVTGINPSSQLTQYTRAQLSGRNITARTTTISLGGYISFWAGQNGNLQWFVDIGGNPNDTSDDLSLPAQTLFSTTSTRARYLSARVRMPLDAVMEGQKMWIVSSGGMGSTYAKLVTVDTSTAATRDLHESRSAGYSAMAMLPDGQHLALAARNESHVAILNKNTGTVTRTLPTNGYLRSLATFGNCLLTGSDESNFIEVFDLRKDSNEPTIAARVKLEADEFSGIMRIAVDQATGIIFARASKACNPMVMACDKDDNRVVSIGETFGQTLKATCLN